MRISDWSSDVCSSDLFINPMTLDLGWSSAEISMALSVSLVVAAVTAIPTGRWLDRHGARAPMILGAFGSAVLLVCWASVTQYWQFVAVWVCLGVCMGLVLTQSAYAAYVQLLGDRKSTRLNSSH